MIEAWRSGCKGCTVYRDGSRSGVLLSTQKDKKDKKEELPPCKPPTVVEVRPKVLEAEVVRFQNNKEWVAFVGLLDGHPYEIFTGLQDDEVRIYCPNRSLPDASSKTLMKKATNDMISSLKTNVDTRQPLKVCLKSSTKNIGTMLN